jgi:TonB-linked SusC/RagA family outer membrane protein
MKKTVVKQRLLIRIMKITLFQFVASIILSSVAMANDVNGQGKLKTKVTLNVTNLDLNSALSKIEESAQVKFSYNSRMAQLDEKVNVVAKNESLSNVLKRVLKPLNITFSEVNNQIVLQNGNSKSVGYTGIESEVLLLDNVAQDGTIRGIVTDSKGLPIPGVSILVEGTNNSASTDFDGKYALKNVTASSVLIFSYVGSITQKITVGNQSTINVTLVETTENLKEVVVVAYGSQKRTTVTGAVSTVNSKDIMALPVLDAQSALQGRAAGVTVVSSGSPGAEPVVLIRGLGTVGNNTPLYVIDGVIAGSLLSVSPSDIESMTVLKDASTTALYGSQGSNGVIMVTTKQGKKGVSKFNFSTYVGFQDITKRYDVLNTKQYLQYQTELGTAPINRPAEIFENDVNYQDELFKSGMMQNYNLSFSDGSDTATSRYSADYIKQEGAVISTGFERYSFRANNTHTFGKLLLGSNMGISFSKRNPERGGGFSMLDNAIGAAPYLPVYNPDNLGGYQGPTTSIDAQDAFNPVQQAEQGYVINKTVAIIGNIYGEYEIIKGLKFRSQVSLDYYDTDNRTFVPSYRDDNIPGFTTHGQAFSSTDRTLGNGQTIIFDNSLTYKTTIADKHNLEALVLVEKNDSKFETVFASSTYAVSDAIDQLNYASALGLGSVSGEDAKIGYVGRVNYDYDEKYILATSIRRDGSARFAADYRWANFYSVSGGWNIGKEDFMKDTFISSLKLRASYGTTGNDKIAPYQYSSTLRGGYIYPINGTAAVGTTAGVLANPSLKWEAKTLSNIGLDFGILNNSLTGSLEFFKNKSDDLLSNVPLPPSLGTISGVQAKNVASVETQGFELSLGYNDTKGDFTWSANVNLGTSENKVLDLGGVAEVIGGEPFKAGGGIISRATVGDPLFYFYGLKTNGIYQNKAEVDAVFFNNLTQTNVQAGDIRYVDVNGDGDINSNDRVMIGNPYPKFTYGANFNAAYKNFDLNLFITGVEGNEIFNTSRFDLEGNLKFNAGVQVLDRAKVINGVVTNPSATIPRSFGATQNTAVSDRFVDDGSYTRLKNISLGYTVNDQALKKYFSKFRVYISAQNLITITNYTGLDPEIGGGNFEAGVDKGKYPQPKSVIFGLDLSF